MRILIVPDKFKGTLTADQAARAMASGWNRVRPEDDLELCPMSDGGDGFGAVMSGLLGAKPRFLRTVDAAHRPIRAQWWWEPRSRTAIVESAQVIGLSLLPSGQFHPFELDTFGLGKVLESVARAKPRRCLIGVGGSATNDGGFGLARALGWRFVDRACDEITRWTQLVTCRAILPPPEKLNLGSVTVAVDVQNRLLGRLGCTRVYGPQKGLRAAEAPRAEAALRGLAKVAGRMTGDKLDKLSGSGAAGGLGFGLMMFLGARAESGFVLFAREAKLAQRLRRADLVISGEGRVDRQSFMGKGVGELVSLCQQAGVPCVMLAGRSNLSGRLPSGVTNLLSLVPFTTLRQATTRPQYWLSQLTAKAASDW